MKHQRRVLRWWSPFGPLSCIYCAQGDDCKWNRTGSGQDARKATSGSAEMNRDTQKGRATRDATITYSRGCRRKATGMTHHDLSGYTAMAPHRNQSPVSSVDYPSDFSLYSEQTAEDHRGNSEELEEAMLSISATRNTGGPFRITGLGQADSPYLFNEELDAELSPR